MKAATKPKESSGPAQPTLRHLKSLVEMAEKPLSDVPKIGDKLKSICPPAKRIVSEVENIKETREWEEKIAERVCRVISAIAQSKARFGAVEIIEKDVETFLQILGKVALFISQCARQAELRRLKSETMDPKKTKNAKQKPEPTVSDEVKKQIEKAIQEAKEHLQKIEDYIISSALNIKNVLLPENTVAVKVGEKRSREEDEEDHQEAEEPAPKRLETDASSKSKDENKEETKAPATPEKAPSTPPPVEKITRSQTEPAVVPSSKGDEAAPVENSLKAQPYTFSNEKEYLQGSPKSSEKDLDSSSEASSPLMKRKWSDDSDQTTSSDSSPLSQKAGWARSLKRKILNKH